MAAVPDPSNSLRVENGFLDFHEIRNAHDDF
jgi:hypothetical protein